MYCTSANKAIATIQDKCNHSNDFIHADELTEGDTIRHFTGDIWLVVSEPEYTNAGITFDVLWLDVDTPNNVESVCFAPEWRFELVAYQTPIKAEEIAA